jgi:formamidopyrimidine-DNA glycosylase
MPELPEIMNRAKEMKAELVGKTIRSIKVGQPKCLNVPPEDFVAALTGAKIKDVTSHGKWIFTQTTKGYLLFNLGMGGEILLVTRKSLPKKHRLVFDFEDGRCLAINFWWFGYAHYVPAEELSDYPLTAKLGPNALDVSLENLKALLDGRRGAIKPFLLSQENIAGIGNAYIHDILFLARLHPLRSISSLSEGEIEALWRGIQDGLRPSAEKGGAFYEVDLYGRPGGFKAEDILIGYRDGKPCPVCKTPIEKIKTGSTSGFVCPTCQPR